MGRADALRIPAMNRSPTNLSWVWTLLSFVVVAAVSPTSALANQDVMLQSMDGIIVTGTVDDQTGFGTLGTRVFRGNFFSSFVSADPGFYGLPTGSPSMPPGAAGFPSEHDIEFDLLPMRIGDVKSNLFYWDGVSSEVAFVNSPGVSWRIVDSNSPSNTFIVPGTDELIPGGLIDESAEDTNPSDGVDTGRVHAHLANQLIADGTPPQGVYMIAWQARSEGFETSEPFLFVHRTSTISNPVRDLAATWAEENIDLMFGPALPGDYNDDGVVDAADYTVWRNSLGTNIALPNEDASLNVVDAEDYAVWKLNYGQPNSGAVSGAGGLAMAVVPEPGPLALALSIACGLALNRKRRVEKPPVHPNSR
jgi:hypothetical protein